MKVMLRLIILILPALCSAFLFKSPQVYKAGAELRCISHSGIAGNSVLHMAGSDVGGEEDKAVKNFRAILQKSELPILMDFYAKWCGPCQMLGPELETVAQELKGEVEVRKLDTDKFPKVASYYGVEGLPTIVLFNKEEEMMRLEGFMYSAQLVSQIKYYMAGSKGQENEGDD
mmetsp:Transcript_10096/g.15320  ORF Transcript_10096/g.15320 Transcript_10096/m.15320 type:complete len:173 (-) Transcript_10096:264-782(-)|eukprot:CAMPEP_0113935852 /NCGR_PEP_ID=MMETSP1339-20121228/2910_1 /TAXON_ID=94617 /ORGANISM="Fibrocapsa japonica" /LENGTH=172 /DNA_ID=CAMNT_0000938139 /DNA_START=100 /DNA_END=618 /DNA_ORIENTATION=+ /assembly_acc=CAM_ASM_000762